jgi:hypothetical protein
VIDAFSRMCARTLRNVFLYICIAAFFLRSEVAIGLAFFDQLSGGGAVLVRIVGLKNFLFVVIQTQPLQPFNDRLRRFIGRTLQVRVFNPQQKFAANFARVQPVEERRARGADVQIAGW